jgi:hypothetical protein
VPTSGITGAIPPLQLYGFMAVQELHFTIPYSAFFAPDGHTTVPFCPAVNEINLCLLFGEINVRNFDNACF